VKNNISTNVQRSRFGISSSHEGWIKIGEFSAAHLDAPTKDGQQRRRDAIREYFGRNMGAQVSSIANGNNSPEANAWNSEATDPSEYIESVMVLCDPVSAADLVVYLAYIDQDFDIDVVRSIQTEVTPTSRDSELYQAYTDRR